MRAKLSNKVLLATACGLFICITIVWVLYGWFGHDLIRTIHESKTWLLNQVMRQRADIPLEVYYDAADHWLVLMTFRVVTFFVVLAALALLLREPVGALLVCGSFLLCSLMLFSLFELYPSLVMPFHLAANIRYYAWKDCCVPDDTLGFRYKPFLRRTILFRGYVYSPVYGVDVPPVTVEWTTDKNGFFNNSAGRDFPDIVLIGDSFVADGVDEADTLGRRLERISGLTVGNLGVPGWGPFHYLEVLKRYGIQSKPKYAFFVFYAGNDIDDITEYLRWKEGGTGGYYDASSLSKPFFRRYVTALKDGVAFLGTVRDSIFSTTLARLQKSYIDAKSIHPEIAVVNIGHNSYRMLLSGENKISSSFELLASKEGQALRKILAEFKRVCKENEIVPVVMYIPTLTTVYAEYSSALSGENWLRNRDEQIARKRNTEDAVAVLARSINMKLINLTPVFESAARDGKLLYHRFDTHWNSEGREVAAVYVAEALKSKSMIDSQSKAGEESAR